MASNARRVVETVAPMLVSAGAIQAGYVWLGFGFLCFVLALFAVVSRLWEVSATTLLNARKPLSDLGRKA